MSSRGSIPVGTSVVYNGVKGVVKFCGLASFKEGEWVGVELEAAVGKNDGTVNGIPYFRCAPFHGVFLPVSKVTVPKSPGGKRKKVETPKSYVKQASQPSLFDEKKRETEKLISEHKNQIAEMEMQVESVTLDKELAEERVEELEMELSEVMLKLEELQSTASEISEEEDVGVLKKALYELRDIHRTETARLKSRIEQLEKVEDDIREMEVAIAEKEELEKKVGKYEEQISDLMEQIDSAEQSEEMILDLTEKKMELEEELKDAKESIQAFEDLKELEEELEQHRQEEIDELRKTIDDEADLEVSNSQLNGSLIKQEKITETQKSAVSDLRRKLTRTEEKLNIVESSSKDTAETAARIVKLEDAARVLQMKYKDKVIYSGFSLFEKNVSEAKASFASQECECVKLLMPAYITSNLNEMRTLITIRRTESKLNILCNGLKFLVRQETSDFVEEDNYGTVYFLESKQRIGLYECISIAFICAGVLGGLNDSCLEYDVDVLGNFCRSNFSRLSRFEKQVDSIIKLMGDGVKNVASLSSGVNSIARELISVVSNVDSEYMVTTNLTFYVLRAVKAELSSLKVANTGLHQINEEVCGSEIESCGQWSSILHWINSVIETCGGISELRGDIPISAGYDMVKLLSMVQRVVTLAASILTVGEDAWSDSDAGLERTEYLETLEKSSVEKLERWWTSWDEQTLLKSISSGIFAPPEDEEESEMEPLHTFEECDSVFTNIVNKLEGVRSSEDSQEDKPQFRIPFAWSEHAKKIQDDLNSIEELRMQIDSLISDVDTYKNKVGEKDEIIGEFQQRNGELENNISQMRAQVSSLRAELDVVPDLEARLHEAQRTLAEHKETEEWLEKQNEELERKVQNLERYSGKRFVETRNDAETESLGLKLKTVEAQLVYVNKLRDSDSKDRKKSLSDEFCGEHSHLVAWGTRRKFKSLLRASSAIHDDGKQNLLTSMVEVRNYVKDATSSILLPSIPVLGESTSFSEWELHMQRQTLLRKKGTQLLHYCISLCC